MIELVVGYGCVCWMFHDVCVCVCVCLCVWSRWCRVGEWMVFKSGSGLDAYESERWSLKMILEWSKIVFCDADGRNDLVCPPMSS